MVTQISLSKVYGYYTDPSVNKIETTFRRDVHAHSFNSAQSVMDSDSLFLNYGELDTAPKAALNANLSEESILNRIMHIETGEQYSNAERFRIGRMVEDGCELDYNRYGGETMFDYGSISKADMAALAALDGNADEISDEDLNIFETFKTKDDYTAYVAKQEAKKELEAEAAAAAAKKQADTPATTAPVVDKPVDTAPVTSTANTKTFGDLTVTEPAAAKTTDTKASTNKKTTINSNILKSLQYMS